MADRIPLIVNPTASQIQEVPDGDVVSLPNNDLKFGNGLNISYTDAVPHGSKITHSGTDDLRLQIAANQIILEKTSGENFISCTHSDGKVNISHNGSVKFSTSGVGVTVYGQLDATQPSCLLTVPVNYTANSATNSKPISFTNTTTNVNCTTSLSPIATQNSGITSISVPSAGTYLVSASISGVNNMGGSDNKNTDQVRFALSKSGISSFPNSLTYPTCVFGRENSSEFNINFTLPLELSASDTLSVHFSHIDGSQASIEEGYFSVTKLH